MTVAIVAVIYFKDFDEGKVRILVHVTLLPSQLNQLTSNAVGNRPLAVTYYHFRSTLLEGLVNSALDCLPAPLCT